MLNVNSFDKVNTALIISIRGTRNVASPSANFESCKIVLRYREIVSVCPRQ